MLNVVGSKPPMKPNDNWPKCNPAEPSLSTWKWRDNLKIMVICILHLVPVTIPWPIRLSMSSSEHENWSWGFLELMTILQKKEDSRFVYVTSQTRFSSLWHQLFASNIHRWHSYLFRSKLNFLDIQNLEDDFFHKLKSCILWNITFRNEYAFWSVTILSITFINEETISVTYDLSSFRGVFYLITSNTVILCWIC